MKARLLLLLAVLSLPALACSQTVPSMIRVLSSPSVTPAEAEPRQTSAAELDIGQSPTPTESPAPLSTDAPRPSITHTPSAPAPTTHAEVAVDGLNLRSGPGTEYAIVRLLRRGDRLQIVAKVPGGIWLKAMVSDGTEGWVHSEYVTLAADVMEQLPIAELPASSRSSPTPKPSSTPLPMPTRTLLPMSSPTPTHTPLSRSSPTATISAEAASYFAEAAALVQSYNSSFSDLEDLTDAASENLLLVLSKSWRSDVTAALAIWKVNGERARELVPPAQFQESHQYLLEASQHFDRAADLATQGIDSLDADVTQQAFTEGMLGYDAITRYDEELKRYLE